VTLTLDGNFAILTYRTIDRFQISLLQGLNSDAYTFVLQFYFFQDSGSDTEFEDDLILIPKIQSNYSDLEERRAYLEKQLGADKFVQLYKAIEVSYLRIFDTQK
jgi:hypothetical protein